MFDLTSTTAPPVHSPTEAKPVRALHAVPEAPQVPAEGLRQPVIPCPRAAEPITVAAPRPAYPSPTAAALSIPKAVLDRTVAAILLVILLPFMLLVALAIRLSSSGPALYRQRRVGLSGEPFTIWKFRTMALDADEHLVRLLTHHGRSATPLFKVPNDPRITPLGKYLRISSIDELPQLVNVLRGQMSLVGPRPQCADEVALYTAEQMDRLRVRPGMTGLWQVSGRSDLGWDKAVAYDLDYVRTWSLRLDLAILARTVSVVAHGHGAS